MVYVTLQVSRIEWRLKNILRHLPRRRWKCFGGKPLFFLWLPRGVPIYIYKYICICTSVYISLCICAYIYIPLCFFFGSHQVLIYYMGIRMRVCVHIYTCTYIYTYIYKYICIYTHIFIYVYAHMYI